MTRPLAAFRCDSSMRIGSGHVMRCRSLARALQLRGVDVVFLCRRLPGDLISLLQEEFPVLVLSELPTVTSPADQGQPLTGRPLYAFWLGCPEEQDAIESLEVLAAAQLQTPTWLIVDHYGLGATWHQRMQEGLRLADTTSPTVVVLDDLADRSHGATVLVDPNRLDPNATYPYRGLVPEDCTTLLGPAYALLDPLYAQLQSLLPTRSHLARVLVFFGGIDAANLSGAALSALSHHRLLHLALDIVVSPLSPHLEQLESCILHRSNTLLHVGLPSLALLMARADLAIGAAGTASWERVCLGLPCLVVPVAENQEQGARALEEHGAARCLNLEDKADPVAIIQQSMLELLDAPEDLQAMSESCLQLGDGRGLARVIAAMVGPASGLHLRPALPSDLWLYYWWASDPQVRRQSFNTDSFSMAEHRRWFAGRLNSANALLFVLEDGDGLPLGQIRFERAVETNKRAVIGFSLDYLARGRGFAPLLLELGLAELTRCWGNGLEAYAEVRADNSSSCRAFLRAEFQEAQPPRPGVRCFFKCASFEF